MKSPPKSAAQTAIETIASTDAMRWLPGWRRRERRLMKSPPKSAAQTAIETIASTDAMRAETLAAMNHKLDTFIMLLERAEQRASVDMDADDKQPARSHTDRLDFASVDRAHIRRDINEVYTRGETNRREIMDYIRHNASLLTRLWNWIGEVLDARRGRELRYE